MKEGPPTIKLSLSVDEVLHATRAVRKRIYFDKPVDLSEKAWAICATTEGNAAAEFKGGHAGHTAQQARVTSSAAYLPEGAPAIHIMFEAIAAVF